MINLASMQGNNYMNEGKNSINSVSTVITRNTFGTAVFDLDSDFLKQAVTKYSEILNLLNDSSIEAQGYVSTIYAPYANDVFNKETRIQSSFNKITSEIVSTLNQLFFTDQSSLNNQSSITGSENLERGFVARDYHYFAQNDDRWGSNKYKNTNISGGACEAMSLVNTIANIGFYDTYNSEEQLVNKITRMVSNGENDFASIVGFLNNERAKNGKEKIKIVNTSKRELCSTLDGVPTGTIVYCSSSKVNASEFASLYKEISNHAKNIGYDVKIYTYGASAVTGAAFTNKGHYLAISGVETNSNGDVNSIYVADSFRREYQEYNGVSSASDSPFEIIRPGIVQIPINKVDSLMDCGRMVVKKVNGAK